MPLPSYLRTQITGALPQQQQHSLSVQAVVNAAHPHQHPLSAQAGVNAAGAQQAQFQQQEQPQQQTQLHPDDDTAGGYEGKGEEQLAPCTMVLSGGDEGAWGQGVGDSDARGRAGTVLDQGTVIEGCGEQGQTAEIAEDGPVGAGTGELFVCASGCVCQFGSHQINLFSCASLAQVTVLRMCCSEAHMLSQQSHTTTGASMPWQAQDGVAAAVVEDCEEEAEDVEWELAAAAALAEMDAAQQREAGELVIKKGMDKCESAWE